MPSISPEHLILQTRRLLTAIHEGDLETYQALCTDDLTCFETDVAPYRIEGVEFHTELIAAVREGNGFADLVRFDLLNPVVQLYEGCGVVTYTRLMTFCSSGQPTFRAFNETRVFVPQETGWKMAHFHRSGAPT